MSESIPSEKLAKIFTQAGANKKGRGDILGAKNELLQALKFDPNCDALADIAVICADMRQYKEAVFYAKRFLETGRRTEIAHNNLGNILWRARQFEEAEYYLRKAAELSPESPGPYHNLGLLLHTTCRSEEAVGIFNHAIAISRDVIHPALPYDRSYAILATGDFPLGLSEHELRWNRVIRNRCWNIKAQRWFGQSLTGQTILIHHEQGFGDSLMFSRYLVKFKELGARVIFAVPYTLQKLFEWCPFIDRVVGFDINEPNVKAGEISKVPFSIDEKVDYHSPLMSAMLYLGATKDTIPSPTVFNVPKNYTRISDPIRVGFCWESGRSGLDVAFHKSTSLKNMARLAEISGTKLYSLQVGDASNELLTYPYITDLSSKLKTFSDTAIVMQDLDVIVTIDSAVAHLAGNLGKPTILLLPCDPCWRWRWKDEKGHNVWYPNTKLIIQKKPNEWEEVVTRAMEELSNFVSAKEEAA